MRFEDKDNYLLKFLLPLAVFLYVITPFAGALRLLQFALSSIVALLLYFMLWVAWPDIFPLWGTTMLILVLVVMLAMVGLAYASIWAAAMVALALVAVPAVHHNAGWIAVMFGAPPWAGYLLMTLFLVLFAVLLWYASVLPLVRTLTKCAFASFFLMVMLRTVHLEEPTGLQRTELACGDSSDTRCPYALDSWPFLALWVVLFGALLGVMWLIRKQRLQRDKDALEARRKRNIDRYNHLVDAEDTSVKPPPKAFARMMQDEEVKESATESFGTLVRRHIWDDKLEVLARSTFGAFDICDKHNGRIVFSGLNPTSYNSECNKCPTDAALLPVMGLKPPIRASSELGPWREAWVAARAVYMEKRAQAAKEKDVMRRKSDRASEAREAQAWQQYTLAAWEARNKVVAMGKKATEISVDTPGTAASLTFIRQFSEDWQTRIPDDDGHGATRPHIRCKVHGVSGSMFPIAGTKHYDPACFICPLAIAKAPEATDDGVSVNEFIAMCGKSKSAAAPASSSHYTSSMSLGGSSMEDE